MTACPKAPRNGRNQHSHTASDIDQKLPFSLTLSLTLSCFANENLRSAVSARHVKYAGAHSCTHSFRAERARDVIVFAPSTPIAWRGAQQSFVHYAHTRAQAESASEFHGARIMGLAGAAIRRILHWPDPGRAVLIANSDRNSAVVSAAAEKSSPAESMRLLCAGYKPVRGSR